MPYFNYSLTGILTLAKAVLVCARWRTESRGAHWRSDHPETDPAFGAATIVSFNEGRYTVRLDRERAYED